MTSSSSAMSHAISIRVSMLYKSQQKEVQR
jgi:hypothetical protein